ncbi:MAG: N-acetylneuraminate synthase family protein, partial [Nitrospinota bacterium]
FRTGCALIDAAAEAGCDGVKFQNYRTADFVKSKDETILFKRADGEDYTENRWALFQRHELSLEELRGYSIRAKDRGLFFHATPTGESGVRDLVVLGAACIKNGSDMLWNIPLIRSMQESGLPVVLSAGDPASASGVSSLWRIVVTMEFMRKGGTPHIWLHCVSRYPATCDPALGVMADLRAAGRGVPVGYSDHTLGPEAAVSAVVDHGACWLEKHLTLDKSMSGPDHWWSADVREMKEIVRRIREAGR